MKRIVALLLLPLLAFTFVSCKPEEEDKNNKLVKTIEIEVIKNEIVVQIYSHTAHYDNKNRLIKIETLYWEDRPPYYYESTANFKYYASTIFLNDSFYYQLDDNGYLIRDMYDGTTFIYENGYLKEKRYKNGGLSKYTWMNGNIVQVNNSFYEYSNKENLLNINIPCEYFSLFEPILKFKGLESKNYLVKETYNTTQVITYDYTLDKEGYPTQIIVNDKPNPEQEELKITLTYY